MTILSAATAPLCHRELLALLHEVPILRTRRDRRPGRVSAGSRTSGRLVAASSRTPVRPSKPSSSVSSWFSVWSRSSFSPSPRLPPVKVRHSQ